MSRSSAGATCAACSLELGGKNAVIVMDDANLDEAVTAVAWAGFGTTGQRCTATSRVIVHETVARGVRRAARRGGARS